MYVCSECVFKLALLLIMNRLRHLVCDLLTCLVMRVTSVFHIKASTFSACFLLTVCLCARLPSQLPVELN